jgi:hypothetical protein
MIGVLFHPVLYGWPEGGKLEIFQNSYGTSHSIGLLEVQTSFGKGLRMTFSFRILSYEIRPTFFPLFQRWPKTVSCDHVVLANNLINKIDMIIFTTQKCSVIAMLGYDT